MSHRVVAILGALLLFVSWACTPSRESISSSTQALSGVLDTPDPKSNVVVELSESLFDSTFGIDANVLLRCSGTLITPLIVLTAGHCVLGQTADVTHFDGGVSITVQTSPPETPSNFALKAWGTKPLVAKLTKPLDIGNANDVAQDYALIYLDPAQLDLAVFEDVLNLFVERPSFTIPPSTVSVEQYFFSPNVEASGYGDNGMRRINSGIASLVSAPQMSGAIWQDTFGLVFSSGGGDSGGPLFSLRKTDGSRDVFGVASNGNGDSLNPYNAWADITASTAAKWIASNALDTTHTSAWNASHNFPAGRTDRWFGEVEYFGPCQKGTTPETNDQDCDHWFDADDNCPTIPNPSQTDTGDKGFGDACPCPCDKTAGLGDYDKDGVCVVPCPGQRGYPAGGQLPHGVQSGPGQLQRRRGGSAHISRARRRLRPGAVPLVQCRRYLARAPDVHRRPGHRRRVHRPQIHDEIDTVPLAAHNQTFDSTTGGAFICESTSNTEEPYAPVSGVTSEMRFCQSNLGAGFNCHDPVNISDGHLADSEALDNARPWHRVTQGTCSTNCYLSLTDDPRAQTYVFDYQQDVAAMGKPYIKGWDYVTDNTYWTTSSLIPPAGSYAGCNSPSYGSGTCLDGTWWSHADTDVGKLSTPTTPNGCYVGSHGDQLANHYFDLRPDATFSFQYVGIGEPRFIFLWKTLPDRFHQETLPESRYIDVIGQTLGVLRNDGTTAVQSDRRERLRNTRLRVERTRDGPGMAQRRRAGPRDRRGRHERAGRRHQLGRHGDGRHCSGSQWRPRFQHARRDQCGPRHPAVRASRRHHPSCAALGLPRVLLEHGRRRLHAWRLRSFQRRAPRHVVSRDSRRLAACACVRLHSWNASRGDLRLRR